MWVLAKGGSGMNTKYQDMIVNILATFVDVVDEDKIYGFYHNSEHYYNTDYYKQNKHYFDELEKLAIEKDEQESRKDKLIEGSQWECVLDNKAQEFGNYKPHVENIKKGLIVEVFNVNGLIIFGHNQSMESWVLGEEQFLACFKPIKEGE